MASTSAIAPPKWLERAEKREFRRICRARTALGRPVRAAEVNTLIDYVQARARINMLTLLASRQRMTGSASDYLPVIRAIEAATTTSRRLAQDLVLVEAPSKPLGKKATAQADAQRSSEGGWDGLLNPNDAARAD